MRKIKVLACFIAGHIVEQHSQYRPSDADFYDEFAWCIRCGYFCHRGKHIYDDYIWKIDHEQPSKLIRKQEMGQ